MLRIRRVMHILGPTENVTIFNVVTEQMFPRHDAGNTRSAKHVGIE